MALAKSATEVKGSEDIYKLWLDIQARARRADNLFAKEPDNAINIYNDCVDEVGSRVGKVNPATHRWSVGGNDRSHDFATLLTGRANLHLKKGNPFLAINDCKDALSHDKSAYAYETLAAAYTAAKDYPLALNTYNILIEDSSTFPQKFYNGSNRPEIAGVYTKCGDIFGKMGAHDSATKSYLQAWKTLIPLHDNGSGEVNTQKTEVAKKLAASLVSAIDNDPKSKNVRMGLSAAQMCELYSQPTPKPSNTTVSKKPFGLVVIEGLTGFVFKAPQTKNLMGDFGKYLEKAGLAQAFEVYKATKESRNLTPAESKDVGEFSRKVQAELRDDALGGQKYLGRGDGRLPRSKF